MGEGPERREAGQACTMPLRGARHRTYTRLLLETHFSSSLRVSRISAGDEAYRMGLNYSPGRPDRFMRSTSSPDSPPITLTLAFQNSIASNRIRSSARPHPPWHTQFACVVQAARAGNFRANHGHQGTRRAHLFGRPHLCFVLRPSRPAMTLIRLKGQGGCELANPYTRFRLSL